MATLSKADIKMALTRLGELAVSQGTPIRLLMVGGGAMVLAFDARESTRDLDVAILAPQHAATVRDLAECIARELGWEPSWLNDAAKGFLVGRSEGPTIFSSPGIEVIRPVIEQLLAMKLCAWRDDLDMADAKRLLEEMTGDHQTTWERITPYLQPGQELKAHYAFEDLWDDAHGQA